MSLVFDNTLEQIFTSLSGEEIIRVIQSDGLVLWEPLIGKYIVENGILNTSLASGKFKVSSSYNGNKSGGLTTATLTISDDLVGKTLQLSFRAHVDSSCFSQQTSRYAYVNCGEVRLETLNMLYDKSFDQTITIEFVPASNTITVGVYLSRTADDDQSTQIDKQGAEITNLQIINPSTGTPYHVVFNNYPLTKTDSGIDNGTGAISTTSSGYTMSVSRNINANGAGFVKGSVSLPTQGCKKVKITYTGSNVSGFIIEGAKAISQYTSSLNSTYIFYTSEDTLQLDLELYDCADNVKATINITDIYFYN